jgi:hypothetical protein
MISKIRRIIQENRALHKKNLLQLQELEWAHVYHDSIRGKKWLENTPLNIGRWAGNYAFFYVLNRILNDFEPKSIIEFGLGESSKFVSVYIDNQLKDTQHVIIEHDTAWLHNFNAHFKLSPTSQVKICPLTTLKINAAEVNAYKDLQLHIKQKFDVYLVDGPFGSLHYSRYDIVHIAETFLEKDEFVIVIDDYNRRGEQETVEALINVFKKKNIKIFKGIYTGNKSVCVLGTEKYKSVQTF